MVLGNNLIDPKAQPANIGSVISSALLCQSQGNSFVHAELVNPCPEPDLESGRGAHGGPVHLGDQISRKVQLGGRCGSLRGLPLWGGWGVKMVSQNRGHLS